MTGESGKSAETAKVSDDSAASADSADSRAAASSVSLEDVVARLDKIEADARGRTEKLAKDLIALRKRAKQQTADETSGAGAENGAGAAGAGAGLDAEALKAEIRYEMVLDGLADDVREEVEAMRAEAGPSAALRLARALQKTTKQANGTGASSTSARAGTAAPPKASGDWDPSAVLRLPEAERKAVLDRIRRGEDDWA